MKLSQFDDIPGKDDLARCQHILGLAEQKLVYVQEKFNGISARAWYDNGIVHVMSRTGKFWKPAFFDALFYDEIRTQLKHMPQGTQLLGELCVPNELLATVSGWLNVKSPQAHHEFRQRGRFMLWDCVTPDMRNFSSRMQLLRHGQQDFQVFVDVVNTQQLDTALGLDMIYKTMVKNKCEGAVYRVDPCLWYEGNSPSPYAWKRTPTYTVEGTCISVAQGMGKRRGMLGAMYVRLDEATTVAVGGGEGLDDEMLRKLYAHPPLGLPVTISYKERSINGTPLRPQFVAVRNYE